MKLILLSISLFALSFSDHIRTPKDISTSIELKIKKLGPLKKNSKDIPVEMFVINRNTFPVYLNNPSCWGATLPVITYNGVNVSPAIKVRVNSSCAKELVP
ncbi:MAG: hypothetical protein ACJ751_22830, partial [Niastella sp.]|uniref:hypothetical protein n=1 Tax=Niastella sp. TaxID=1869183 RepID=UPI00389A4B0B